VSTSISSAVWYLSCYDSLGLALSNLTNLSGMLSYLLIVCTHINSYNPMLKKCPKQCLANVENDSVSMSRIHEVASLPAEEDPGKAATSVEKEAENGAWPAAGSIVFHDVTMRYK